MVTWPDTGSYTIQFTAVFTDQTTLTSFSKINLISTKTAAVLGANGYNALADKVEWVYSTQGQQLGARLQIEYGCGNKALNKPFIYVEGFNPRKFYLNQRGETYYNLWKKLDDHFDDYPNIDPSHIDILHGLEENGYDIVYVDFNDGSADLKENAHVLKEVLNWVNQEKAKNGSTAPNVVWGENAGGVIARIALKQMEDANLEHDCSYYVSFDSPHLGMNVPLSHQILLTQLYNIFDDFDGDDLVNLDESLIKLKLSDAIDVLNSPASKQLIIHALFGTHTGNNSSTDEHIQFKTFLANLGMPQQTTKNIAIANGSGDGDNQGFNTLDDFIKIRSDGASLLNYVIDSEFWSHTVAFLAAAILGTDYTAKFDVKAMPGYSTNSYRIYWQKVKVRILFKTYHKSNLEIKAKKIQGYDASPGGAFNYNYNVSSAIINQLNNLSGINIKNPYNYCYLPMVSALNIVSEINNPYYSIPNETQVVSQQKTNFQEVHVYDPSSYLQQNLAQFDNEIHANFTPSNADVFENYLFNYRSEINDEQLVTQIHKRTYNFGANNQGTSIEQTTDRLTRDLTVSGDATTDGVLCVNCNDKIAFTDIVTNPQTSTDHFGVILTAGCGLPLKTELVIDNHGVLEIGTSLSKTGSFTVSASGVIRVKSGGRVVVKDGSRFNIADGGEFIFEEGASLELEGYGSLININGKLTIGNNADFTFTGNGRLVFNQDVKWATNASGNLYLKLDEYWDIGANTSFTVEGPSALNMSHFLIEAHKPVYLKTEDGRKFDQVTIKNGRVAFHQDALLFSFSPTHLRFVRFEAAYSWQTHGGFRLWNNPGPNTIMRCDFYNGKPAALMHWVGGGNPITFSACNFDNNETGLEVQGGNFKLNNCSFNDNYQAVYAENLTGQSFINSSNVIGSNNAFHDGVYAHAQNGATLTINSSEFTNCIDGLHIGANISARAYCSEFTLNGRYGILAATCSSLDIGNEAENVFAGNQWDDIYLTGDHEKSAIYLDEGKNDFAARGYQGGSYLQGRFSSGMPVFLGGVNQIPANNNKMPTYTLGSQTYMPVDFTWKPSASSTNWTNVILNIPNNLSTIQRECTSTVLDDPNHTSLYRVVASFSGNGGNINTPDYPNSTLKNAVLDAIDKVSFGEDLRNDDQALVLLTDILEAQVLNEDVYTDRMRAAAYQQMHQGLSNCYQNGGLMNVQGEDPNGVNDTVDDVINVIDQFITDLDPNDTTLHFQDFKYHLDKAHVYRVSGYYDEALAVLQTSVNWTYNTDQTEQAGYWQCVCEAENAYFNNELPEEEYAHQIETCNQQFYGNNYKQGEYNNLEGNAYAISPSVDLNNISLFPQPVNDLLTLEILTAFDGKVSYTISDVSGKVAQMGEWHWIGTSQKINVSGLITGVYFISLQFGDQPNKTLKFVKE